MESDDYMVDVEALIITTFFLGNIDKRLILAMLEWIEINREWISGSRLKRMVREFEKKNRGENITAEANLLLDLVNDLPSAINQYKGDSGQFKEILVGYHKKGVVRPVPFNQNQLIQLYFRSIFGINSRADIFTYLLGAKEQNTNRLAKEIYYDQKIVYRILQSWERSGFVRKEVQNKQILYSLYKGREMLESVGFADFQYINWLMVFTVLRKIYNIITNPEVSDDPYLLSSQIRIIYPELLKISRIVDLELENEVVYPGDALWHYLQDFLLEIFKKF